jgi:hypothetical protein
MMQQDLRSLEASEPHLPVALWADQAIALVHPVE